MADGWDFRLGLPEKPREFNSYKRINPLEGFLLLFNSLSFLAAQSNMFEKNLNILFPI